MWLKLLYLRILTWILGRPYSIENFTAEVIDMSNVRLRWTLPTPGPRQRPIAYVRIDVRASDTLPWTEQDRVTPDVVPQELLFENVAPGTHYYRGVVVDDQGAEDLAPKNTSIVVPYDPPSSLTEFTATLE